MEDFQKKFAEAKEQLSNFEKSIKSLQSFANSILDYEHLEEIDEMWERLSSAEEKLDLSLTQLKDLGERIDDILHISHINELDCIWDEIENKKKEVSLLNEYISSQKKELDDVRKDIQILLEFKKDVDTQEHISDIDESWSELQKAKEDISVSSERIQETENLIEVLSSENKQQFELIQGLKADLEQSKTQSAEDNMVFKSKVKLAYIVSGGAVCLTILQFILNIVGVL